ncbi:MAG: capsular biosynthesis protein [Phototrophicales bacterium]|nr:MAG: capsular biosynthesis protein [Phototrophicales bacterium]
MTNLITIQDPRSSAADAYRTLRTNLMFSNLDTPLRTLGVTSAAKEDQKGIAAANLAVTFAQAERKVLLIEADLRRPVVHTFWNLDNSKGLTSTLLDEAQQDEFPIFGTNVEGLRVLCSGPLPANPVDVLASSRLDKVVQQLMNQFDVLIFHMPPVLVGADTLVLGQKLDGVLLVAQAHQTRRDHLSRAKTQLERIHIRLLGAVLLDAPPDRTSLAYR